MHRYILLLIICSLLCWSNSSYAAGELGENVGVNANPHNLSSLSTNPKRALTETQICIFCHVPHSATTGTPLWGRPDPDSMGSFPTFDLAKIQDPGTPTPNLGIDDPAIIGTTRYGNNTSPDEYPNGASKLCLSCHDGVTAMGILATGKDIDMSGTGTAMAIDLSKSHPISFVYTQSVEDHLNLVATSKFYDFNYYTGTREIPLDGQSRIQCTICHEPHKDTKDALYTLPFWRMAGKGANAAADYDLTCGQCHSATYYSGANHNIP